MRQIELPFEDYTKRVAKILNEDFLSAFSFDFANVLEAVEASKLNKHTITFNYDNGTYSFEPADSQKFTVLIVKGGETYEY